MDKGTILERGTHDELLAARGLYADLCRHQLVDGPAEPSAI
jgi:ABC-type multidrug transport system fused ATPase/permease subunit